MSNAAPDAVYDDVLDCASEELKRFGFSRRRATFRLLQAGNCGIVEFQRSAKSSATELLFTINLGIVCGDLPTIESPRIESAKLGDAHVRLRIGVLLPDRPDKWWKISVGDEAGGVANEIVGLLRDLVVPYIRRHITTEAILALWESGQSPGLTEGRRVDLLRKLRQANTRPAEE